MFDTVKELFRKKDLPFVPAIGNPQAPPHTVIYKAWVVIEDGRPGYVDHYKSDGKFGVRPMQWNGLHYPNPTQHWSNEDRLRIPEELALTLKQFRAAEDEEIPPMYRKDMGDTQ